jgi:cohesin complex subunit SA-1/2
VRRRGRPRKVRDAPGKKLFDKHNISDEESISASDHQGHGEDDTDDDADQPLINTIRPSFIKAKVTERISAGNKWSQGSSWTIR